LADVTLELPYEEWEWLAISKFVHHSWFERIWVRQEIGLAKANAVVMCGFDAISWRSFTIAYQVWILKLIVERSPRFQFQPIGNRLRLLYDLCGYGTAIFPFLGRLRKTAWCSCQDPRDKIFSILGLMPEEEKSIGIRPDYTLTKTEVYQNVVLKLFETTRRLDVLLNCEMRNTTSMLPSWVPDWSVPAASTYLRDMMADIWTEPVARNLGGGILQVSGVEVATFKEPLTLDVAGDISKPYAKIQRIFHTSHVRHLMFHTLEVGP
jgi:hypothetical protein